MCLLACSSKKVTTNTTKIDSVLVEKTILKIEQLTDTITIKQPCDEKGNLKAFNQRIKTNAGFVHVYNDNGNIKAKMHLNGSEQVNTKQRNVKIEYKDREVIKYKKNYTLLIILIISIILNVIFVKYLFHDIFF